MSKTARHCLHRYNHRYHTNLDLIELNKLLEDNIASLLNNDSVVKKGII